MQLLAGRTGQEFNQRKRRKGAYWEDRYHATAIERNHHLVQCMVYIDLNMVRAGVVSHPAEWDWSGYNEIQAPRQRYSLIDYRALMEWLNISSLEVLQNSHRNWVEETLRAGKHGRERKWSESLAVGSQPFAERVKGELGFRSKGRKVVAAEETYHLREAQISYRHDFGPKSEPLRAKNVRFWNTN